MIKFIDSSTRLADKSLTEYNFSYKGDIDLSLLAYQWLISRNY